MRQGLSRERALWGLTRTEYLRTYTEFVSMTTIVRCPRTGRACSEGACRERHWLSAAVRAWPVAQRACCPESGAVASWRTIDRSRDRGRQSPACCSAATSLDGG